MLGTLDGANVEISEHIGLQNMFIFGERAEGVMNLHKTKNYRPLDKRLEEVIGMIMSGVFGNPNVYAPIINVLSSNDSYLVGQDFPSYLEAQDRVDSTFKDKKAWTQMSILNCARMGYFSSDRAVAEYAQEIWGVEPYRRPGPAQISMERLASSVQPSSTPFGVSPQLSTSITSTPNTEP